MEHFLLQYGYGVLLVGVLIEGETPVVLASVLVHQGYFSLWGIALIAGLASFAGDQFYFHLARWKGRDWLQKIPSVARFLPRAQKIVRRNETWLILWMRFFYGMRVALPALIGLSGVSWKKYLALNFIGAGVWAFTYTVLGYLLGQAAVRLLGSLRTIEHYIIWAMIGLIAAVAVYRLVRFLFK